MCLNARRGISEVISSLLLFVIALAVLVIIATSIYGYYTSAISYVPLFFHESKLSMLEKLKVVYGFYKDGTVVLVIYNYGDIHTEISYIVVDQKVYLATDFITDTEVKAGELKVIQFELALDQGVHVLGIQGRRGSKSTILVKVQ